MHRPRSCAWGASYVVSALAHMYFLNLLHNTCTFLYDWILCRRVQRKNDEWTVCLKQAVTLYDFGLLRHVPNKSVESEAQTSATWCMLCLYSLWRMVEIWGRISACIFFCLTPHCDIAKLGHDRWQSTGLDNETSSNVSASFTAEINVYKLLQTTALVSMDSFVILNYYMMV